MMATYMTETFQEQEPNYTTDVTKQCSRRRRYKDTGVFRVSPVGVPRHPACALISLKGRIGTNCNHQGLLNSFSAVSVDGKAVRLLH